jgi:nickel-type superoxide dismutase maturation protease
MLRFIKVTGNSLYPDYQEGDYVMIITIPFFPLKKGDTIVFHHPEFGRMIKIISRIETGKLWVKGTNPNSVDSRQFGYISRESILGKVIWHVKRPSI